MRVNAIGKKLRRNTSARRKISFETVGTQKSYEKSLTAICSEAVARSQS